MFFNSLSLKNCQRITAIVLLFVMILLACLQVAYASPGAHGPNGEHLDSSNKVAASENPKFESFTESFELLGEVFQQQLVIYLHDFKSNIPVEGAAIDIESGELSASASYSDTLKAYTVTEQKMLEQLSSEGEHEIVLTVMSAGNDDLLVANLINSPAKKITTEHEEEHHHHFPWWQVIVSLTIFAAGFLFGRSNKESKS